MSDLFWANTTVRLGDLKPWPRNPKTISKRNAERLLAYWTKVGQFQTVAIGPDGEVYDGHQRLNVLLTAFGAGYEIDARQSSRALTEDERAELVLAAHTGTTGAWDWDALAGFDEKLLQDCGFDAALLKELNDDAANLRELINSIRGDEKFDPYEHWQGMPEYEQGGIKPFHLIQVHFASAEAVQEFGKLIGQGVSPQTKFVHFPKLDTHNPEKESGIDVNHWFVEDES